jgi:hypothetical protein
LTQLTWRQRSGLSTLRPPKESLVLDLFHQHNVDEIGELHFFELRNGRVKIFNGGMEGIFTRIRLRAQVLMNPFPPFVETMTTGRPRGTAATTCKESKWSGRADLNR